jgi:hypothetical protein
VATSPRRIPQNKAFQKMKRLIPTIAAASHREMLRRVEHDLLGLFARDHAAPPTGCRVPAELPYRASMSAVIG